MTQTVCGKGSIPGTYEANCQKVPGKDEIIHKQVLSLGNTAIAVRGQNRFEESIISVYFPLKLPAARFTSGAESDETLNNQLSSRLYVVRDSGNGKVAAHNS